MTETWNASNPQLTNQVSADIPDIQENFSYLMAMHGYWVDSSEANQGIAGSGNSVKDLVDSIGTSKKATLVLKHNAADGNTTTYTFGTSETIPSNIELVVQHGARIAISTGVTLTINGPFTAGRYQVFSLSGTGVATFGTSVKEGFPEWWGDNTTPGTTDMAGAIQNCIDSGLTNILFAPTTYYLEANYSGTDPFSPNSHIFINRSNVHLKGIQGQTIFIDSSGTPATVVGISGAQSGVIWNYESTSGYTIDAAVVGEMQVTTTTASEAGNFSAGDIVFLKGAAHSIAGQYYGNTNKVVSANASTGVILLEYGLAWDYSSSATIADVTDDTITDIVIDGIYFQHYGEATGVGQVHEFVVKNNKFKALGSNPPFSNGIMHNVIFENNFIENNTAYAAVDFSRNSSRVFIKNNIIYSALSGIAADESASDIHVIGNQVFVKDATGTGLAIAFGGVSNGIIDNNQVTYQSGGSGAAIYDSNGDTSYKIRITNNTITTNGGNYVIKTEGQGTIVSGNILKTDYGGMLIVGANSIISNNVIFWSGDDLYSGIVLYDAGQTSVVTGNVLFADDTALNAGIYLDDDGDQDGGPTIIGNQFTNCTYGVYIKDIDGLPGTVVENNTFVTVTTPIYGIYETLADDATPSVKGGRLFLTGGTTGITDFDDGYTGQIITIIAEHAVSITDGTNIFLAGNAYTMAATDTLTLIQKADGKWYELARSDNTP